MEKCKVKQDIVTPCRFLQAAAVGNRKAKGVIIYQYASLNTGEVTRDVYALRSGEFARPLALTYCPFCGVKIGS